MITKEQFAELLKKDGSKYVRVRPEDCSRLCYSLEDTLAHIAPEYADHLIGFSKPEDWYSYDPVFDAETQKKWDDALQKFYTRKAEWCAKYGCE